MYERPRSNRFETLVKCHFTTSRSTCSVHWWFMQLDVCSQTILKFFQSRSLCASYSDLFWTCLSLTYFQRTWVGPSWTFVEKKAFARKVALLILKTWLVFSEIVCVFCWFFKPPGRWCSTCWYFRFACNWFYKFSFYNAKSNSSKRRSCRLIGGTPLEWLPSNYMIEVLKI